MANNRSLDGTGLSKDLLVTIASELGKRQIFF